ncbi:hypothetical protein AVEN_244578-1, partial [Araneus ventricosus]
MHLIKDFIWAVFVTLFICTIAESNEEVTEEGYNCTETLRILNGSEGGTGYFRINFEDNCT